MSRTRGDAACHKAGLNTIFWGQDHLGSAQGDKTFYWRSIIAIVCPSSCWNTRRECWWISNNKKPEHGSPYFNDLNQLKYADQIRGMTSYISHVTLLRSKKPLKSGISDLKGLRSSTIHCWNSFGCSNAAAYLIRLDRCFLQCFIHRNMDILMPVLGPIW